jgi:hypothetical protein
MSLIIDGRNAMSRANSSLNETRNRFVGNYKTKWIEKHRRRMDQAVLIREKITAKLHDKPRTKLSELVNEISKEGFRTDMILREIISLQERQMIEISESSKCNTFLEYLMSPNSLWFFAALGTTFASVLLLFIDSAPLIYFRYFFEGMLVLFLPGYSFTQALYPKKSQLDDLTRYAITFASSLALAALIGLVLGVSPFGLRIFPIASSLSIFNVVCLLIALKEKYSYYNITKSVPDTSINP